MELYIFQALMGALMFGIGAMLIKWNAHIEGDDNLFFAVLYSVGTVCFFLNGIEDLPKYGDRNHYIGGVVVGLGAAGGNYLFARGLRIGPAGLTSAFSKANIVIVILLSSLYYREALTLMETIGILCFISAMVIVNLKFGKSSKSVSKIWFVLMLGCMTLLAFRNGGLKIAEELELSSMVVMTLAYALCALIFIIGLMKNAAKARTEKAPPAKVLFIGASTGIVSYAGLDFYIRALEAGPASVVVTLFSLDMLFVLIMSYLIFGERLLFNQKVGFALSALGFLLLAVK